MTTQNNNTGKEVLNITDWFFDDGDYERNGDPSEIYIRKQVKGELFDICSMNADETNFPLDNAKAICTAVNETYGKGYNPAGVEELYKALEIVNKYYEDRFTPADLGEAIRGSIDLIVTALQKAKL